VGWNCNERNEGQLLPFGHVLGPVLHFNTYVCCGIRPVLAADFTDANEIEHGKGNLFVLKY
jgi:hypothetical protein